MGTGFCLLANQVGCVLVLTGTLGTCHIIMPKVIHTLAAVDGCLKSDVGFFIIGIWEWAVALKFYVGFSRLGLFGEKRSL